MSSQWPGLLIVLTFGAWFFFELGAATDGDPLLGLAFFPLAAGIIAIVVALGIGTLWGGATAVRALLGAWREAPSWLLGTAFILGTMLPVLVAGRITLILMR